MLALISNSCAANDLSGRDDPNLQRAVSLWLENDDRDSIPQLAELARNGNIAARLLLSRIERTERAPSAYRENLTLQQHYALFRNPVKRGPFSISWMLSEAESGNTLAQTFLSSYVPKVNLEVIRALQSRGELQATDHPVRIAALYGDEEVKRKILKQLGAPQMRPFVKSQQKPAKRFADGQSALDYIMDFAGENSIPDHLSKEYKRDTTRFLALGIPYGEISTSNPWRASILNWLEHSEETKPIHNACKAVCTEDIQQCEITVLGLTGGFYEAIRLDTPLESLISQPVFLGSARAASQAMRRAALIRAEYGGEIATISDIASRSLCLAEQVQKERSSNMYQSSRQP